MQPERAKGAPCGVSARGAPENCWGVDLHARTDRDAKAMFR